MTQDKIINNKKLSQIKLLFFDHLYLSISYCASLKMKNVNLVELKVNIVIVND